MATTSTKARNNNMRMAAARLIHLPVPYGFRPARYQEDEDEAEFCETPFFHEIPPSTAAVGNMRLTPMGAALADQLASSTGKAASFGSFM